MRLLIAEDDGISRKVLTRMLAKWGHEIIITCDGNEAWSRLQEPDAPKMVILDWMMPGMDGVDVCSKLRQLKSEIRPYVILLTGMQQKKDLITAMNAGADDYITKPFEPDEWKVRIHAGERILNLQQESLDARQALEHQATHDSLSGLWNRGWILDRLAKEFTRPSRTGLPTSVVMADIDYFKKINDTHGHAIGDAVIVEASRRMSNQIRGYEYLGRYGGEEFLAVLSQCNIDGALQVAERMRAALECSPFNVCGVEISVTGSFGVASTEQLTTPSQAMLLQFADEAMYRAKKDGRNQSKIARVSQLSRFFSNIA